MKFLAQLFGTIVAGIIVGLILTPVLYDMAH